MQYNWLPHYFLHSPGKHMLLYSVVSSWYLSVKQVSVRNIINNKCLQKLPTSIHLKLKFWLLLIFTCISHLVLYFKTSNKFSYDVIPCLLIPNAFIQNSHNIKTIQISSQSFFDHYQLLIYELSNKGSQKSGWRWRSQATLYESLFLFRRFSFVKSSFF